MVSQVNTQLKSLTKSSFFHTVDVASCVVSSDEKTQYSTIQVTYTLPQVLDGFH